jgi:2-oxoglutarate ferredoxin oxidoreductase subunit gamma
MRVRFSGLGGQGVVMAGVIYGHAAMLQGFDVLQRQSYGSTTRGGVTTSDVTTEHGEIHEIESPDFDVIVALCQEAHDKYRPLLVPGGLLLTESTLVDISNIDNIRHIPVPAIEVARERLGRQILTNIVILGALARHADAVGPESLRRAISAHVPPGTERLNFDAFDLGWEAADHVTPVTPPTA